MCKSGKKIEVEQQKIERTFYAVVCPECKEWHEQEESKFRGTIECICGTDLKIVK